MSTLRITLPSAFTLEHERVLTQYLADDHNMSTASRRLLFDGIDLLGQARVEAGAFTATFQQIYNEHVDEPFASDYLAELLELNNITEQSPSLVAKFARQISPVLLQSRLLRRDASQSYLLLAYCVYWWQSFARGYAFEVEIMRDLEASDVDFAMHDLRSSERYSQADLIVLGLLGDIKISTYFLRADASLKNDFYITRLYDGSRERTLVVMQKPQAWQRVGGEQTVAGNLQNVLRLLPQPVQLMQEQVTLIVVEYDDWKRRVKRAQTSGGAQNG